MKNCACLLSLMFLYVSCLANVSDADLKRSDFVAATSKGKIDLPYLLYSPENIKKGTKLPLVIFLHGIGSRGDDNEKQLARTGFLKMINRAGFPDKHPCYMLAPQCPAGSYWSRAPMDTLLALVAKLVKEKNIDTARIYITGLSMGGFGTWEALKQRPGMFAAALPICGGGKPAAAKTFANVPIWVFHGDKDETVKPEKSREMVAALKKAGGQPKFTELKGVGHGSWSAAYTSPEVWQWMFQQKLKTKKSPAGASK